MNILMWLLRDNEATHNGFVKSSPNKGGASILTIIIACHERSAAEVNSARHVLQLYVLRKYRSCDEFDESFACCISVSGEQYHAASEPSFASSRKKLSAFTNSVLP